MMQYLTLDTKERLANPELKAFLAFGGYHLDEDGDPRDEIGEKTIELDRALSIQADAMHGDGNVNLTAATIELEAAELALSTLIFSS